jgi:hypothetical protein
MAVNLPLIRRSWPYRDFGNWEFEMQRPKPLVTPFPELRYGNSCMRSTTLVDLDLTVTIPLELKGVERHSVLIARRGFVYQDFVTCEDEGSCPLVSRMPKCRNLFTLNRLIHRAHRGFVYRDFATCEDEGSFPLVSRMPKCRPVFTLSLPDGHLRPLATINSCDLFGMINGCDQILLSPFQEFGRVFTPVSLVPIPDGCGSLTCILWMDDPMLSGL